MAVVDELVTLLSYKMGPGTQQTFDKFQKGVESLKVSLAKWSTISAAAGASVAYFIKSVSDNAVELQKVAHNTDMSVESLQKWQYAAEAVGASANAVTSDLENMITSMSSPIPGQLNMELMMLGVSVRDASGNLREAEEVLGDVGDKLSKMDNKRAIQWASKVGISKDTLMLLQQGRANIRDLFEEAQAVGAIIPEDAIERGAELSRSINTLKRIFKAFSENIALSFAPNLKKLVDNFKSFLVVNGEFVRQGLSNIVEGLGKGFSRFWNILVKVKDTFVNLLQPLKPLVEGLNSVKVVSSLVTGALTGMMILFAPLIAKWIAIRAAIAAVALVIEDFITWTQGGQSVFGEFVNYAKSMVSDLINSFNEWLNQHPRLKESLETIGNVFKAVFAALPDVVSFLGKAIKDTFEDIVDYIQPVIKIISFLSDLISNVVGTIHDIGKGIGEKVFDVFNGDKDSKQGDARAKFLAQMRQRELSSVAATQATVAQGYGTMPVAPSASQYGMSKIDNNNSNSTINNNQSIYIQTGADARSVTEAISTQIPNAQVLDGGIYGSYNGRT